MLYIYIYKLRIIYKIVFSNKITRLYLLAELVFVLGTLAFLMQNDSYNKLAFTLKFKLFFETRLISSS